MWGFSSVIFLNIPSKLFSKTSLTLPDVPQDVDVNLDTKKGDWKKNRDNMIETIKEAKKTRPPSAKKDIEVQIVMKAAK